MVTYLNEVFIKKFLLLIFGYLLAISCSAASAAFQQTVTQTQPFYPSTPYDLNLVYLSRASSQGPTELHLAQVNVLNKRTVLDSRLLNNLSPSLYNTMSHIAPDNTLTIALPVSQIPDITIVTLPQGDIAKMITQKISLPGNLLETEILYDSISAEYYLVTINLSPLNNQNAATLSLFKKTPAVPQFVPIGTPVVISLTGGFTSEFAATLDTTNRQIQVMYYPQPNIFSGNPLPPAPEIMSIDLNGNIVVPAIALPTTTNPAYSNDRFNSLKQGNLNASHLTMAEPLNIQTDPRGISFLYKSSAGTWVNYLSFPQAYFAHQLMASNNQSGYIAVDINSLVCNFGICLPIRNTIDLYDGLLINNQWSWTKNTVYTVPNNARVGGFNLSDSVYALPNSAIYNLAVAFTEYDAANQKFSVKLILGHNSNLQKWNTVVISLPQLPLYTIEPLWQKK